MKKIVEAFETVKMPESCEATIRSAMKEKRNAYRTVRRRYSVAAALVAAVLMISLSTEVRAEVREIAENWSGTSFFTSLRTRQVRRKGSRSNSDGKRRGIIITDRLNVRKDASYDSKIVASLHNGERIEILEERNGWFHTQEGWICKEYVYEEGTTGARSGTGVIVGDQVNIRSGPGPDCEPVGTLSLGDYVDILEQVDYDCATWGYVEDGWICMDYVELYE